LRFTAGKPLLLSDARDGFLFDRLFGLGLGCEDRRLFEMRKRMPCQRDRSFAPSCRSIPRASDATSTVTTTLAARSAEARARTGGGQRGYIAFRGYIIEHEVRIYKELYAYIYSQRAANSWK
jgi:hypothetical protein